MALATPDRDLNPEVRGRRVRPEDENTKKRPTRRRFSRGQKIAAGVAGVAGVAGLAFGLGANSADEGEQVSAAAPAPTVTTPETTPSTAAPTTTPETTPSTAEVVEEFVALASPPETTTSGYAIVYSTVPNASWSPVIASTPEADLVTYGQERLSTSIADQIRWDGENDPGANVDWGRCVSYTTNWQEGSGITSHGARTFIMNPLVDREGNRTVYHGRAGEESVNLVVENEGSENARYSVGPVAGVSNIFIDGYAGIAPSFFAVPTDRTPETYPGDTWLESPLAYPDAEEGNTPIIDRAAGVVFTVLDEGELSDIAHLDRINDVCSEMLEAANTYKSS